MPDIKSLRRKAWRFIKRNTRGRYVCLKYTKQKFVPKAQVPHAIIHMDAFFLSHDKGRYGFIMCRYFQAAGYQVVVRTNYRFYEVISKYKESMLASDIRFVRSTTVPPNSVSLTKANGSAKTIQFKYGFDVLRKSKFNCIAPYPMESNNYNPYPSTEAFEACRRSPRTIQIFFAGTTSEHLYRSRQLEATFNVFSRNNLLDWVKKYFENSAHLQVVKNPEALQQCLKQKAPANIIISEAKTDPNAWLHTLGHSAFFICAPGVWMPWCHNLIEVMSVGTIPILEYAHLMTPNLKHLKNCLAFNNPEELKEVLQMAMEMSEEEIARMQAEVIDYFERHLSLNSVITKINDFSNSGALTINVALPFIKTRNFFKQKESVNLFVKPTS